jgi:hypothetical protein
MRMKLNYTPQVGLRRRKPDHHRERLAFWGGIAIVVAFEFVLMAKGWTPSYSRASPWPWSAPSASSDADNDAGD